MKKFEIIRVDYGKSTLPESMIFINGDEKKTQPIVFTVWLIKTNTRLILADAGSVTMPGFDMTDFIGPIKALENIGISPLDIDDVIITHAHHDHIECVSSFKNANIYIQKDEYANGKEYFADDSKVILFDDYAVPTDGIKVLKIGGHSIGSSVVEIYDDDKKYLICGDECYKRECIDKKIPTGASYSPQKSREFIDIYADSDFNILLCHDI